MYIKLNKGKCSGNIKIKILNIMLKKMCADLMVKLIHLKTTKPSRTEEVFIASLCKIVNSFFSLDTLRQMSLSRYAKDTNVHGVKMTSLQMRL